MFDVGFSELVLISIIGLLVLGPQRLPKVAAEIGKWVGRARRTATQLRRQLEREIELSDLEEPPNRPPPPSPPASTALAAAVTPDVTASPPDADDAAAPAAAASAAPAEPAPLDASSAEHVKTPESQQQS